MSPSVGRRQFLKTTALGGGGLWLASCAPTITPTVPPTPTDGPFHLGVMSGLHAADAVVLWTRVDPLLADGADRLDWVVATDPGLTDIVASGSVSIAATSDWTAKVLVEGLGGDRSHWFRFRLPNGATSAVGRARTLPAIGSSPPRLRLGFASCQLWRQGWYNAWAGLAAEDLDAVVWLGDYIYESGAGSGVRVDPIGTATTLDAYRAKYRLYRSDPMLQAGHAAHPFVPVWDDHEFVDNYSAATVAARPARAAAAYRAWFEYMPVWPIDGTRIHRTVDWGRLARLTLLDTRQYRDVQPSVPSGQAFSSGDSIVEAARPGRSILGAAQRDWLLSELEEAQADGVRWKLIANQVMISPTRLVDLDEPFTRALDPNLPRHAGVYRGLDSWDGYFDERDLLLGALADRSIADVSFLTGDVHSFWQSTLRADYDDATSPFVANEFVSGAISSPTGILGSDDLAFALEAQARNFAPGFRYVDLRRNGYGVVDARPDSLDVTFRVTNAQILGAATATSVAFGLTPGDPVPAMTSVYP